MNVPDPFSQADWKAAEEMKLRCEPISDQANALVDGLLADLAFLPTDKAPRPTTIKRRRRALGALLADLLRCELLGVPGSHGMAPRMFPASGLGFGPDVFMALKDAMVTAGLLHFSPGKQRLVTSEGFGNGPGKPRNVGGWVSRFRLTPVALERVEAAGVALDAWEEHWRNSTVPKPDKLASAALPPLVQLKASNSRDKGSKRRGQDLPLDLGHPTVRETLADLEAHNAFMLGLGVDGIDFLGLRRVFNEGDKPEKRWRSGGRFYSITLNGFGTAYEQLKGPDRRRRIRFGGQAVGEADMGASQLMLLYALQGVEMPSGLDQDPYGLHCLDRDAVKAVVAQALGKGQAWSIRWGLDAANSYKKRKPGRLLQDDCTFSVYQDAVLAAHPVLKALGRPGVPTALDLQFVESEVIRRAMRTLRDQGIGSLPVHDSLIVDVHRLGDAEEALQDSFRAEVETITGQPTSHRARVTLKTNPH